ncbi:MAG: two-component system, LytTR family, response regulator [Gaiellaceae bacterium]|jgi:DNA-binding LytR/AlgR family response regulator|nr:two-component system, LytTR family, response regulator [Gaiellaceae bacterium]
MIRALLVDDEAPARSELRYLLATHPEVEVVGEAATAVEALKLAGAVPYDVVFIDVEMPGLSGLDAARLVHGRTGAPQLVFVTAHEQYAIEAFAVEALDYLLKPVDPERLAQVVRRLGKRPAAPAPVQKIPVVSGGETVLVDWDDVHYARADGDYSRVHTYDRSYLCTRSLRELEETLPAGQFARIHRSYLVNLRKVAAVKRPGGDRLRLALDDAERTELDVARRQSKAVRERLRV